MDIEENLWCPTLGLKGKVDVSLDVKSNKMFEKAGTKGVVIPLELKTGKASITSEHIGQLALYNMMLRELNYDSPTGLLLYLRYYWKKIIISVSFKHSFLRRLWKFLGREGILVAPPVTALKETLLIFKGFIFF